jgi:hypothetical protein
MSPHAILQRAQAVRPSPVQGSQLRVIPILGPSHDLPPYRLLDEATLPHVRVTEVSHSGSVPDLLVQNDLPERIFLMDGQELVGAKQNRILNTGVLVPAKSTLRIPVSCVEQGRWRYTTKNFRPGNTASHRTRSAKSRRVHSSLRRTGDYDADQGAVWEEVSQSLHAARASSSTGSLSDAYLTRRKELEAIRQSLQMPAEAVGLAVFRGRRLRGIDLFDRHPTLARFWSTLLDSYAIDYLAEPVDPAAEPGTQTAEAEQVVAVLGQAAGGKWEPFPTPGEGVDWRLGENAMSASALVWDEQVVVHLQVFPHYADEQRQGPTQEDVGIEVPTWSGSAPIRIPRGSE